MAESNGNELSKAVPAPTTRAAVRFNQLVRNPTAWVTGLGMSVMLGAGAYVIHESVATHERTSDIKAAARAWAAGKPSAFKGLSKVAISELKGADGAPLTIARSIIEVDFASPKDRAAFACATAAINSDADRTMFTYKEERIIQLGLEPNTTVAATEAALDICNDRISADDSLLFPVGKRGDAATTEWLSRVPDSNYITKAP